MAALIRYIGNSFAQSVTKFLATHAIMFLPEFALAERGQFRSDVFNLLPLQRRVKFSLNFRWPQLFPTKIIGEK